MGLFGHSKSDSTAELGRPIIEVSGPPTCLSNGSRTCRAGIIRAMTERGMAHADGAPACPSSHSRTTGTSAPTDRTTVTVATPRFIRRRVPSPTRRRTACRVRSRSARPSRTGRSARLLELGEATERRFRLRGQPLRSRRPTIIATTRRPDGRPNARTRGRRPNRPPNGRDRRRSPMRSATTDPRPCRHAGTRRGTGRRRRRQPDRG